MWVISIFSSSCQQAHFARYSSIPLSFIIQLLSEYVLIVAYEILVVTTGILGLRCAMLDKRIQLWHFNFTPLNTNWQILKRIVKLTNKSTIIRSPHSCPPVTWAARLTSALQSLPSLTTSTPSCPHLLSRCRPRARKSSRTSAPCRYEVRKTCMNYQKLSILVWTSILKEIWIIYASEFPPKHLCLLFLCSARFPEVSAWNSVPGEAKAAGSLGNEQHPPVKHISRGRIHTAPVIWIVWRIFPLWFLMAVSLSSSLAGSSEELIPRPSFGRRFGCRVLRRQRWCSLR